MDEAAARRRYVTAFLVVFGLGVVTMFFRSSTGLGWIGNNLGGTFYVLAGIFLVLSLRPAASPVIVSVAVFIATCGIEFLQLWHPPWLEAIRATTPGRLILGTTYNTPDFAYYTLGLVAGILVARSVVKQPSGRDDRDGT